MDKRICFTGSSVNCALGEDTEKIISLIKARKFSMDFIPLDLVDSSLIRPYYRMPRFKDRSGEDRTQQFYEILFDTVSGAFEDAGLTAGEIAETAVFFGSTSIDIPIYEYHYEKSSIEDSNFYRVEARGYGRIANEIAERYGCREPTYTFTTACTSSANGVLYAASMIQRGFFKRAIVIGYDFFNSIGLYGFESLKLIANSVYKPFDKRRDGIILGEGCGAIVLEFREDGKENFFYLGGSNICDTQNVTAHDIEGGAIARVISDALVNSGVDKDEIAAIKAHATGSGHNDLAECLGIGKVFSPNIPPVTGIKPFIGHTVGASGVIESILIIECVKRGFFPASLGFKEYDEELGIEPITENLPVEKGIFLLNFFGFGGNCTSFVISNQV
jgi:3-oxoacyl-(acyl-carrier-protein) synthase